MPREDFGPRTRTIITRLLDALTRYERACGREHLLMVLPDHPDCPWVCNLGGPFAPSNALLVAEELPCANEIVGNSVLAIAHRDEDIARATGELVRELDRIFLATGVEYVLLLLPMLEDGDVYCWAPNRECSVSEARALARKSPYAIIAFV